MCDMCGWGGRGVCEGCQLRLEVVDNGCGGSVC